MKVSLLVFLHSLYRSLFVLLTTDAHLHFSGLFPLPAMVMRVRMHSGSRCWKPLVCFMDY